jgi:hypothetical protein
MREAGVARVRAAILAILASALLGSGMAEAQVLPPDLSAEQLSFRVEYLHWWFNNSPVPIPLITDGAAGAPTTHVLLGDSDLENKSQDGFRVTFGYATDRPRSLEVSFLSFKTRSASKSVESSGLAGSTDLLLPYFDVLLNRENVTRISQAPVNSGAAREELSRSLTGAEINFLCAHDTGGKGELQWISGLRWLRLAETFTFTTSSPLNPPRAVDIWSTTDRFETRNNFYGVQVGARGRHDWGRFFAGGAVKIGLGAVVQTVDIDGFLLTDDFTTPGTVQRFTGGYFALPSNIGHRQRAVFAVIPEAQLDLGYQIAPWVSFSAGYSFLYTNSVARPGNQLNRNINTSQSVSWVGEASLNPRGPAEPSFEFHGSSFWAHGVNAGFRLLF